MAIASRNALKRSVIVLPWAEFSIAWQLVLDLEPTNSSRVNHSGRWPGFNRWETNMIRILCFMLLVGLAQISAEVSAKEGNLVYVVGIDGLACPFCSYGVEKQIQKLEGVEQVETNIRLGQLRIQMLEGKTLARPQVEAAIERAGFDLRSFEQAEETDAP